MPLLLKQVTNAPATNYNTTADLVIPFVPKKITLVNDDGTAANDAFVSFDGKNDQVHLDGGVGPGARHELTAEGSISSNNLSVWVRKGGGSAPSSVTIMVQA